MLFWGKAGPWGSTNNNPSDVFVTQLVLAGDLSQAELRPIRSQDSLACYQYQALPVSSSESSSELNVFSHKDLSVFFHSNLFSRHLLPHLSLLSTEASEGSQLHGCHGLLSWGFSPPGLLPSGPYSTCLPLMTVVTTIWGTGVLDMHSSMKSNKYTHTPGSHTPNQSQLPIFMWRNQNLMKVRIWSNS